MSAWEVTCPTCGAKPGALCTIDDGRPVNVAHVERLVEARQVALAGAGRQPPVYRGRWRR